MVIKHKPPMNLSIVFDQFRQSDEKKARNVASQYRKVYPELQEACLEDVGKHLADNTVEDLLALATPDLKGWALETLADLLARGAVTEENAQACFRHFRPFLDCVAALAQVKLDMPLSDECQAFSDVVDLYLPADKRGLEALLSAGITCIAGIDCTGRDIKNVNKRLQGVRSSLRTLLRQCTDAGIDPKDIVEMVILPDRLDLLPILMGKTINYYDVRNVYNTVASKLSPQLPPWPMPIKPPSVKPKDWPTNLKEGLEAFLNDPVRKYDASTVQTHRSGFSGCFGIIEQEVAPLSLLVSMLSPEDSLRLMFQGWPADFADRHFRGVSPRDRAIAVAESTSLRTELLTEMQALVGTYDGRASEINPLLAVYLDVRYAKEEYSSARNHMNVTKVILDSLGVVERHRRWAEKAATEVSKLEKAKKTRYKEKKKSAFRDPDSWPRYLQKMLPEAEKLLALPSPLSQRDLTDFRNVYYFLMALCFPFRPENFEEMRIGANFDPKSYRIHFESEEVKNEIEINQVLPEVGPFAILRRLTDRYFDEVRPALLQGNPSAFVFVPNNNWKSAGTRIPERGFNDILHSICKQYLEGLLPTGVDRLNPHLMRHTAAIYLVTNHSAVLASQLLGDRLETVLAYYADVRYDAGRALKAHFESFRLPQEEGVA